MSNKDLEKRLKEEIESITPNDLDGILEECRCNGEKARILEIPSQSRKKASLKWIGMAAAFLLVFTLGITSLMLNTGGTGATIALDVNPGIELTVNRKNKVESIVATNDDGTAILENLNLEGAELSHAIETVVTSLLNEGYLTTDANSILVSVNSGSEKKAISLQAQISEKITRMLSDNGVEASVLTQTVSKDNGEISALADEHNMSAGKARLINELVTKDGRHTFEELSRLTINELSILLRETNLMPNDVKSNGEASRDSYITKEKAIEIAAKRIGAQSSDLYRIDVELDYSVRHRGEKGDMIYDVKFIYEEKEYKFDIDAKSGEILMEKEDERDPKDPPPPEKKPRPDDMIGKERALDVVQDKIGIDDFDDRHFDTELKCDGDGNWFYEIELFDGDEREKIRIDASTGHILE